MRARVESSPPAWRISPVLSSCRPTSRVSFRPLHASDLVHRSGRVAQYPFGS